NNDNNKDSNNKNIDEENSIDDENFVVSKLSKLKTICFGLLSGVMAGVFGISGSLPITTGLYSLGLKSRVVIGTTVFVLIFNSLAGIIGYYALGRLDIPIILLLAIGSIIGGFLGPKILNKIDSGGLEKYYPPFMIALMIVISICLFFG
ncbi:MAG: sulfite exporter TauE/SafE family protein, partial [Methanobacteriaceae archaeon]|nr:sulfite exporter TauE/SafE family protein [Methanobacteriaceae archaeon]